MYSLYEQPCGIQINGKIKQGLSNQFSKKKKGGKKGENSLAVKGKTDR